MFFFFIFRNTIRIRKSIPPRLQTALCRMFCSLCEEDKTTARDVFQKAGLSPLEMFELVMAASLRDPAYTPQNLLSLHRALLLLLTARCSPDDRLVSGVQDLARRVLLKQEISPALFAFILVLLAAEQEPEVQCPGTYTEEWERRLTQVTSFHVMHGCFRRLLAEAAAAESGAPGKFPSRSTSRYCLADVFDAGQGRLAELVAKWLVRLGSSCHRFAGNLDSVMAAGGAEDGGEVGLVAACAQFFPRSMEPDTLLVHLAWEELQVWQVTRDAVDRAASALAGIRSISCHALR
jgi:hypothetical protein